MKKKPNNRAFTLIELLVVIAIIGVLSSVVLASLNSARNSGKEAGILASLKNISTQAEIYRTANGTYEGLCEDPKISEMVDSLDSSSEGAACAALGGDNNELYKIDYGFGATINDIYYGAGPTGTYTFDNSDVIANNTDWNTGKQACSDAGKRLPGPLVLQAIYNITNDTPKGFESSWYWSYLTSPSDSTLAYVESFADSGGVSGGGKGWSGPYVRCVH